MDTYIIPPINTEGLFKIASPFWKEEYDNVTMKLVEIRNIQEMVNANIKVYELIYEPVGLSKDIYEEDNSNEVPILSFSNSKREHIYIPANRLGSVPDISGERYQSQILSFNLGLLPVNFDNTSLVDNIKELIEATIGVTPTSKVLLNSAIHMVSESDAEQYTTTRTTKIKSNNNIYGKYNTLFGNYTIVIKYIKQLVNKNMELEEKVKNLGGKI